MNILITGIHGFVGSNIVSALKNYHTIYGLDIVSPHKNGIVKTFRWNELGQIPFIDVVIHLAGKAHDTKNKTYAQVYFDINTGLTQQIFDWFLSTNAKKFIFFSSVKAVADKLDVEILTEDVTPAPKGPYGESKLAAENYLTERLHDGRTTREDEGTRVRWDMLRGFNKLSPAQAKQPVDKKVYILRPCMIHGPGNKGNLNLLYKLVQKGLPWPLGAFENKRSFTSIDNLTYVVNQLLEIDIESGIYNISDDDPLSTNQLIELISHSVGKKSRIWNFNSGTINIFAKLGDLLHLPFNSFRLQKLTENYVVSNDKIKRAIGVNRLPVKALEGMARTLASFKKVS